MTLAKTVAWRFYVRVRYPEGLHSRHCYVGCGDERDAKRALNLHGDIIGDSDATPLTRGEVLASLGVELKSGEIIFKS